MATIINIQPMRRTETTNTGVTIKLVSVKGIYRVFAFNEQIDILEEKEYIELSQANLNFNYMVSKYSKVEKFDIVFESSGTGHKYLYTNLDLKGRGISLSYISDKGYKVYSATKLAFEKIRGQHSVKFAEHGIDTREIA
ncbi:hypothetical protein CAPN004_10590 [Capnocytophaga cynodegmi]|uniref:hypothetical protein n=1 Tax=Capnocytophaga cynodegmi TaxID=28189 RepID=UPI001AC0C400|nr:hypothetical protein [Capnocytophaga cynodegmi]GIM52029.1 hypothetical protein CAPN004_10590 [Capnocytophaga cynodegmi]